MPLAAALAVYWILRPLVLFFDIDLERPAFISQKLVTMCIVAWWSIPVMRNGHRG